MLEFIKNLLSWLWTGKWAYFSIAVILFIFYLDDIKGLSTLESIKYYSLILQLIGGVAIIYSLKEKLILFKSSSFSTLIVAYFKSFPWKKRVRHVSIKGQSGSVAYVGAEPRAVIKPKEELSDIIRYFNEEIVYLQQLIAKTASINSKQIHTLKLEIDELKMDYQKGISDTKLLLIDSSVSNVSFEIFVVVSIIVGIVLSTIPESIGKLLESI